MKNYAIILVLILAFAALAESETQTDWEGGPGIQGPVTDWQNRFFVSDAMDWDTEPGQLKLIVDRSENQIATADGPFYVIAVDMNMNGYLDAASCAYNSGEVFWVRNVNGQGTQWAKHIVGNVNTPRYITVSDFDGNGYRDIAVSSDGDNKIVLFRNYPSGFVAGTTIATNFDARQLRAVDVDGDGLVDIVGVSSLSGDVCWWKNDGTGSGWNINYIDGALMGAYAVQTGDFNGDGHVDIVAASNSQNTIAVYLSQPPYGYSWNKTVITTSYSNPVSIAVADFNNDGRDNFAIASSSGSGNLRWYDYLDTQSSWIYHQMTGASAQNIYDIAAHDMDGDGYPDLLAASYGENRVVWCKNREYLGEPWETFSVTPFFGGALGVSAGDMDGDGVPDVMGCAFTSDKISWWRVSGFTSPSELTSSILDIEPPDPSAVEWDYIHWSATLPSQTGIRFQLRTSYNSGNMGSWSAWINSPGDLASVVVQGGRYLQYKVQLYTNNPNITPSLKDVTILWNPVSIEGAEEASLDGRRIWLNTGNPVTGAFSLGYRVMHAGDIHLAVYDVSGRMVSEVDSGSRAPGDYSVMVTDLPAGSYVAVMRCPAGMAAQRVVVIR